MNKKKVIKCAFCMKEQKEEEGNHHKVQEEENNGNEEEEEEEEENEDEENGNKKKKKKEPVMITNVPKKRTKYANTSSLPSYYNFSNCPHVICIKCIARILFTSKGDFIMVKYYIKFNR